jgi:hypothetical protein
MARVTTIEAKSELVEQLLGDLPHGSGINYDWDYEVCTNGSVRLTNAYDVMNEHGMYMGSIPFTIILNRNYGDNIFKLQFSGFNKHYLRTHAYGLRDYLEDTFYHYFQQVPLEPLLQEVA